MNLTFISWCAHRIKLREPTIAHANVKQFPVDDLIFFLGDYYVVIPVMTNPNDLGHPVNRERRITLLIRKDIMPNTIKPFPYVMRNCRRQCRITWRDLILGGVPEEADSEMQWAE
eukprot:6934144-Pyramimonas_sp.AAC.1